MPFLFAITPRAGRWNHRLLAPADAVLSAADLRCISAAAQENPTGEGYVAARRSVRQETTGRTGEELLILADLDTGRLGEQEVRRVQQALESRMSDLDRLVTREIDWDREGRVDPVIRAEMRQWLSGELADLPGPKPEGRVVSVRDKLKKKKKILRLLLVLGVLAGGGVSYSACDPCQKWVNSLPDKFPLMGGGEASAPVSLEDCKMLKGLKECTEKKITEKEIEKELPRACDLLTVDENDCKLKSITDEIGELNKDESVSKEFNDLFKEEFPGILKRHVKQDPVSWDTLYGKNAVDELNKLNDATDRAFKQAIGRDNSASFDRYVQALNYRAKLRKIYDLIPDKCKENNVKEEASRIEIKKDALRYREIVGFMKTVQEHEKKREPDLCFLNGKELFAKADIVTVEDGRKVLERQKEDVDRLVKDQTNEIQAGLVEGKTSKLAVAKALLAIIELDAK